MVDLARKPRAYLVRVTADNRFVLYVNGVRVAAGPSTGDIAHWRVETIDLAPFLRRGHNIVAAVVWNGVQPLKLPANPKVWQIRMAEGAALMKQTAPNFQQSVATGLHIEGKGDAAILSTRLGGWRVRRDEGHGFENGYAQLKKWFYVAGPSEIIDASKADFDWAGPVEIGPGWVDAVSAPEAARRTLVDDPLPQQSYVPVSPGKIVRGDLRGATRFPGRSLVVPANSKVKLLLQRDAMVSAYPQLDVSGGAGATVKLTWSEALNDADLKKGDRNLIEDRKIFGVHDTFLPDGQERTFAPCGGGPGAMPKSRSRPRGSRWSCGACAPLKRAIHSSRQAVLPATTRRSRGFSTSAGGPRASMRTKPTWTRPIGNSCNIRATPGCRC
ncbi:hypothetical protein [Sphingobium herbicidovorans]|uniref:hypothetical protein n=1 Tax=Sphingobium herbicidovorans TaxID=76947 RepID=UPI001F373971|nr:hypothetical protein [Sphingobium herbicidovorans]